MSNQGCCLSNSKVKDRQKITAHTFAEDRQPFKFAGRTLIIIRWIFPGVVLALLPKCPLCLAAYIALATGIGISLSTAGFLQLMVAGICMISLLYLTLRLLQGYFHIVYKRKKI